MWQYSIIPQGLIEGDSMGMIKVYAHIARKIYSLQKTDREKGISKSISTYCTEDLIFYIAKDTGLRERSVKRIINQLVKQGYLNKKLKGKSNLYSISGESEIVEAKDEKGDDVMVYDGIMINTAPKFPTYIDEDIKRKILTMLQRFKESPTEEKLEKMGEWICKSLKDEKKCKEVTDLIFINN